VRKPIKSISTGVPKPAGLLHHPSAANVVAVRGGNVVSLLDTTKDAVSLSDADTHADAVTSMDWSVNGSALFTCCKDKSVKIYDPRDPTKNPLQIAKAHSGMKAMTVKALTSHQNTNTDMFLTCGQTQVRAAWSCRHQPSPPPLTLLRR
jgi:WD40 repeat protein